MEVFDDRVCDLAEAPWYDERTGRVGWVDIMGRRVLWRDPATGATGQLDTPDEVSAAVPRAGYDGRSGEIGDRRTFAGPGYRTLVITSGAEFDQHGRPGAGLVYVEHLADVAGRPVDRFAG